MNGIPDTSVVLTQIKTIAVTYAPKLLLAVAVLVIGLWIIKHITKLMKKMFEKKNTDASLRTFATSLVNIGLKALLLISVAGMIGIETTSFIALLGAVGLAVGFALQGSLANFAGGVLILIFKPFKVGDLIEAQGYLGHVRAINVFVTTLETPESKTAIIPNGPLANDPLTNFTKLGKLRVDLVVGVGYDTDIKHARDVLTQVMKNDDRVLADPAPVVMVLELADSSINLAVRPYTTPEHYWGVYFDTLEKVKEALDDASIEIPFPHRVVHHVNKM